MASRPTTANNHGLCCLAAALVAVLCVPGAAWAPAAVRRPARAVQVDMTLGGFSSSSSRRGGRGATFVPRLRKPSAHQQQQHWRRQPPRTRLDAAALENVFKRSKNVPDSARAVAGAATLVGIDECARIVLGASALPHSLVAGAAVVLLLSVLGKNGERVHGALLAPGAKLALAWMPAFFAPNLVALPLAPPVASTARDLALTAAVIVGGLFTSLAATAFATTFFAPSKAAEKSAKKGAATTQTEVKTADDDATTTSASVSSEKTELSDKVSPTAAYLSTIATEEGAAAWARTWTARAAAPFGSAVLAPLALATGVSLLIAKVALCPPGVATAFFASSTLVSFIVGSRLAAFLKRASADAAAAVARRDAIGRRTKRNGAFFGVLASVRFAVARRFWALAAALLHPVATCAALVTLSIALLARVVDFAVSDATTTTPLLATTELYAVTGGAFLQRLLGACVVALACGVYDRRGEIAKSWRAVTAGVAAGVGTGLYGTACAANALDLPLEAKYALLTRCVTSPLALPICDAIGAPSPAASMGVIVASGILGAALGPAFLNALPFDAGKPKANDQARGLAMGAAAHGIGTAQLNTEPAAQPYASIAMSLCGALSVVVAAVPMARDSILFAARLPPVVLP